MAKIYTLKMAHEHVQRVLSALADLPFKQVNPIIVSIMQQAEAQDKAEAAAAQQAADTEAKQTEAKQANGLYGNNSGAQDGLKDQEAGDHHEA